MTESFSKAHTFARTYEGWLLKFHWFSVVISTMAVCSVVHASWQTSLARFG